MFFCISTSHLLVTKHVYTADVFLFGVFLRASSGGFIATVWTFSGPIRMHVSVIYF